MDRKDETMNLDDIRAMLNDVPDTDEFDLDAIIAEVEGLGTGHAEGPAAPVRRAGAGGTAAGTGGSRPARRAKDEACPRSGADGNAAA